MKPVWKTFRLSEVGKIVTGKTPSTSKVENFGGGIPFVTPSDMDGRKLITNTERTLSEQGARSIKGAVIPAGSVVVSCIGSDMGKASIVARRCVTNQQINSIIVDEQKFSNEFVYYNLSRRKAEIRAIASGSAQPILNKAAFSEISVDCPSLQEQKEISSILRAFDDKIELNRKMNATLEAMAQALFKAWFVDFEPVKAKAAGRTPESCDAETAALFPDEFVDSELGAIPKGWKFKPLGEIANVNWGDTRVTKSAYVDKGFPAYSASGQDGSLSYFDFDKTGVVVSAIGANSGVTWLATGKWSCIKNTMRFWATDEAISTEYLYRATLGQDKWSLRGSAQPFISQSDTRLMRVLVPFNSLAKIYGDVVESYHSYIQKNLEQNQTLATLRDSLLPKLISGQLRIPDAEALAEAAV